MQLLSNSISHRSELIRRWGELKQERATWVAHWRELSQFFTPRSGRFFVQDRNKGQKRHNNIYDSTPTRAARVLSAGLMANMTSPARPWFRLETADKELNKSQPVKAWLSEVTMLMLDIFARSNTYTALQQTYEELGVFGTAAKIMTDDFKNVIHHHSLTIGEYAIATNYKGQVNTIAREFEKTVAQLVAEFGYKNCSVTVRNLYDRGTLGAWVPIIHIIEPRADRDLRSKMARDMAFSSCYFEVGSDHNEYLREGGFKEFPALCSRWAVSGGDVYGNSPGMEALGDAKQLQQEQLRKGQAIDYMTKPPLQVPASMKGDEIDIMPGGITYYDGRSPDAGIRSAFNVQLDINHLLADIQDVRERIKSAFYADLWLALEQVERGGNMTAYEVAERKEEKLLLLGPTSERLHAEELTPLIERTFERMIAANILPPPPEEMHGMTLNVSYVSMLAQAQRAVGTNGIDRFVSSLGQLSALAPQVVDNFDADEWVHRYSDMLGVDPKLIIANDKVALVRQQRAEQQAQAAKAAQMEQAASTAQKLSAAQTTGGNALSDITRGFTGYT